jgi:hydrogenase nickel incorporation protein HypA/HybF
MHEVALAQSIVDMVEELSSKERFARVRTLRLAVGALSHVAPHALELGLESAALGTVVEGAKLVFDRPDGSAFCTECSKNVAIGSRAEPCPLCGGHKWILVGGDELRVVDLEVE